MALLQVEGLEVRFRTDDGVVNAINGVSFEVHAGETLAVVGESGSGKSVTAMAIMRLLPRFAELSGRIVFDGQDLTALTDRQMRKLQGNRIAMIFQDPMTAMNPVFTVGNQLTEAIRTHNRSVSKRAARTRATELLELVGIPEAARSLDSYPHEFSGGMRQRAMIAMGIANEPELLIADEPTTALDVTIQAQVLEVMRTAQEATGAAMLLITHDLGLVAGVADRVQVMYGGRLFESGDTRTVYYRSRNPYTRGLMTSIPSSAARTAERLQPIAGSPPSALSLPAGCVFRPRCAHATDRCREELPMLRPVDGAPDHLTRCHHAEELPPLPGSALDQAVEATTEDPEGAP